MDKAIDAVLDRTNLSDDKKNSLKKSLFEKANSNEILYQYLVVGQITDEGNMNNLRNVMGEDISPENAGKYSLYTVCLASAIKKAAESITPDLKEELYKGIRAFVEEFDAEKVARGSSAINHVDNYEVAMRKKGYASNPIEYNIEMLIEQAEYLARKGNALGENAHFENTDYIKLSMFKNATEPAVQKYLRAMATLSALPGIPVFYCGDELGMTGGERKSKNVFLQNRNAIKFLEMTEGIYKEYRQRIADMSENIMLIRSRAGVDPLNSGTPYMLNAPDKDVISYMMQNGNGDIVVPIINLSGVNQEPRVEYYSGKDEVNSINKDNVYVPGMDTKPGIDYIELPEHMSLPEGTVLKNTDPIDKEEYTVVKEGDKYRIKRKSSKYGDKIVLNGDTAKNGVLILTTMTAALASGAMYKKGIKTKQLGRYLAGYLHKV